MSRARNNNKSKGRESQQFAGVNRSERRGKKAQKVAQGEQLCMEEQRAKREEFNLGWFNPTESQKDIIYSMTEDSLTLISASSGTGKSTTVIYKALQDYKAGLYKKIIFIKTPVDSTDDSIGFLPSTAEDKLKVHFEVTKGIFCQFMSEAKLEMEEKRGNIQFKIPNFIQGATLDDSIVIIDESQQISPPILKLLMERIGKGSKLAVLGDKRQCYANKKRVDGFTNFVDMVTSSDEDGKFSTVETIGYVELSAEDNMRSPLSKLVVSLYEED